MLDDFITQFGGWTESYFFYNGTIELRFDKKAHVYLLVQGDQLIPQSGVTSTCHIIDKSNALIPWACKKMAEKIMASIPRLEPVLGIPCCVTMTTPEFEALINDAKTAHKEHLEAAGEVGNLAHNWIEGYIKLVLDGTPDATHLYLSRFPSDERAKNCCIAALDWMQQHNVEWVSTERKIYSRSHGYAGTMDGLCYVDSCSNLRCCPNPFKRRLSVADWKSSNYLYMEYMLQTAAYQFAYQEEHGVTIEDRWVIRLGKEDGQFEPWHLESECYHDDFVAFITCLNLTRSIARIEDRIKARAQDDRASRKADRIVARQEALKLACVGAAKYKGVRRPHCNGGNPCQSCLTQYALKHPEVTP
jgi:hypothetical protein